jgi:nucleosome assembly protein 1-like 1
MQAKMDMLELDFELGMILRNTIVPNALLWFTGEAQEDDSEDDSDFDPAMMMEGEEEESEDDESDEGDEGVPAAAFPSMGSLGNPTGDEKPAECKQQ